MTRNLGLGSGGTWRSQNGGDSFFDLTPKLNSSMAKAGGNDSVTVTSIFSQKSAPNNVVFIGSGSYIWLSKDFGDTISRVVRTPGHWRGSNIRSMKLHPTRDNWLLVLVRRPSCRPLDYAQMECPHDLFLTQDLFGSMDWVNLTANAHGKLAGFVDFDWGINACPTTTAGTRNCSKKGDMAETMVMATMYAKPGDYDQPWDPDVHFVMSSNLFKSFETHVPCGNMFEIVGEGIYIAYSNSCPVDVQGNKRRDSSTSKGITLYTSADGGLTFDQACLPVALKQEGYELMETHDGKGAVVVVDFVSDSGSSSSASSGSASSMYTAGPHHAVFSLSLTNVHRSDFGFGTDLTRIEGIPGFFMANQMLPAPSAAVGNSNGNSGGNSNNNGGTNSNSGGDNSSNSKNKNNDNDSAGGTDSDLDVDYGTDSDNDIIVESRITFNGGGRWQRVPAPKTFNNPQCNRCSSDSSIPCFLHLNGPSAWNSFSGALPSLYSSASAPGLVIGTGNVAPLGAGLNEFTITDGLCTWLSTDGGSTWRDVGVGAYIYEFADWGGVIVMARHPGGTSAVASSVLVSLDYGSCWTEVPLTEAMTVENIRIEPDGQRPRVIVHGRGCRVEPTRSSTSKCGQSASSGYRPEGLMYVVDVEQNEAFSPLPNCKASDRVPWTVSTPDGVSAACVLGNTIQIQRRRADASCLNGAGYVRPAPITERCPCTQEDVECDFGWMRPSAGGVNMGGNRTVDTCTALPESRMQTCPLIRDKKYMVSSTGKRLLHADVCNDASVIIPDTDGMGNARKSPSSPSGSGAKKKHTWAKAVLGILSVVLILGASVAWWALLSTSRQRDLIMDLTESVVSFLIGVALLAKEKAEAIYLFLWTRFHGGRPGDVLVPSYDADHLHSHGAAAAAREDGTSLGLVHGRGMTEEEEVLGYFQPLSDGFGNGMSGFGGGIGEEMGGAMRGGTGGAFNLPTSAPGMGGVKMFTLDGGGQ
eukprot:CAMPEP_0175072082 /NCGR_PEP_ID=MMETSP0052_2-20121109/19671_1 /TAXON_ID=51329 ORGANISM="Polytomella parva, Strain SAG 63-3" /NCGR_SAMPLE_ID=MMETSP0052_2 /ASSEMBLY_ACC=CAM_ASM_000194 /LENGTH=978 /DNA_ID=CAMNT_0016339465 /DNA_START=262 /DNA_END=3198 /DNA_ORIENTATION=+